MNKENLIPFNERTENEVRAIATKGGINSGKARREKKLLKELLEEALLMETDTGNKYIDITRALIEQAATGNVKAFEVIRDTMGQKATEKIENTVRVDNKLDDVLEAIK